jgi:hypothetical protein
MYLTLRNTQSGGNCTTLMADRTQMAGKQMPPTVSGGKHPRELFNTQLP